MVSPGAAQSPEGADTGFLPQPTQPHCQAHRGPNQPEAAVTHDGERGNTTTAPPVSGAPAHTHGTGVWPTLLTLCDPPSCGLPGLPPPWPATNGTLPGHTSHWSSVSAALLADTAPHCHTPTPASHTPPLALHSTIHQELAAPTDQFTLPLLRTRVRWRGARPLGLHTLSVSQSHSGKDDLKATCLG